MAIRYSGHWLRTRRQAMWQSVALLLVLVPMAAWRATTQPLGVGMGLGLLAVALFVVSHQSSRFLEAQEQLHDEPTPGMAFVFRFVVNMPLTFGALLFVVLVSLE